VAGWDWRVNFRPTEGRIMAQAVDCPCGVTVRGETDDELVTNVEQHVQSDHPDMVGSMTRDKILEMAHDA
jgi:predicted small metal-binding protein